MKALTSDVIGQAKKKSPIKEQKQAIETLEKEEIHHHTSELIQKKMSTNERNCYIEVKNELKDFMDETDKAKYIFIFLYNFFIFIITIESNLVSKIKRIISFEKIESIYNFIINYKFHSIIKNKEINFISKTEEKRREIN